MNQPAPQPGQPYPGMQPAPAAPPKRKRKWPWILLAVVGVLVVISVASGGGDTKDAGPNGATSGAGSTAAAGLNTPVRDGKFEFTVTGVEPGLATIGDNPYLQRKAQGQFVIVSMTVQNTGDKPQAFTPSAQKLKDSQGRTFESDTNAQIALGDSDIPLYDSINPGNTVSVKVVYDMPVDAVPSSIELHDSMFSGGATVNLN